MTRVRESYRGGRGRNSLRSSGDTPATTPAFSLIELLVVIAIIIALAGLILSTVGYVQKKSARSRAETEIAAMSAALESYKADNGIYPRDANSTDLLNAQSSGNPSAYQQASLFLYTQLSAMNPDGTTIAGARSYFTFKPNMLGTATDANGNTTVAYIRDPFGSSYGYSTIQAANPGDSTKGYNPTFDLWSTAGITTDPPNATTTAQWIKNW